MAGILEGLRVVELSLYVAVPAVGAIMSDWGAEVIKIEMPNGDPCRRSVQVKELNRQSPPFTVNNRGKKSVVLDLGTEDGMKNLHLLLQKADVFVTNFRQEVLSSLKLTPEEIQARHPRLVIGLVSGYGDKGPEKQRPGFDVTAFWARSGLDSTRFAEGGDVPRDILGVGDNATGLALLTGVLAALRNRDRTGHGQIVSTSLLRTAIFTNNWATSVELNSNKSTIPKPRTSAPNILQNSYRTKDKWIWLVHHPDDRRWGDLCKILGHPEWQSDERFNTPLQRAKNAKDLIASVDAEFIKQPLSYWAVLLDKHDLVWAPIQTVREAIQDPQVNASGAFVPLPNSSLITRTVATPVDFSTFTSTPRGPAPELGKDTKTVLQAVGVSASENKSKL